MRECVSVCVRECVCGGIDAVMVRDPLFHRRSLKVEDGGLLTAGTLIRCYQCLL